VRLERAEQVRDLKLVVLSLDPPRALTSADIHRSGLATNPDEVLFERP
jgi:hypothetical protein